ncbi:MAG TPA: Ig-like domain-containing protein [Gemmatimonadaceae bacterium]|nr:Ig-like domain-containing protein [Gemmatimonadaceae bacterium]
MTVPSLAIRLLRRAARPGAILGVASALLVASSCGREPTGMVGAPSQAFLDLGPLFQTTSTGNGGDVKTIRISLYAVNLATSERRLLQTFTYDNNSRDVVQTDNDVTIRISFSLVGGNTAYQVEGGAYGAAGDKLYNVAPIQFTADQAGSGTYTAQGTAVYVGPGADATRITITQRSLSLKPGDTQTLTATAVNNSGATVSSAPLRWQSDNPQVAFFQDDRSGVVTAGTPGTTTLRVSVEGLSNVADAIPVTVAATPVAIVVTQGNGQSATTGTQLQNPIVVRVLSTNNIPVQNATVTFSADKGGSASPATATTDNTGSVQTRWTLGSSSGQQTLTISTPGLAAITATATANLPPIAINIMSITPTQIVTGGTATAVVQVTQSGAPLAGATVTFNSGGATPGFASATATTGSDGRASATFSSNTAGAFNVSVGVTSGGQTVSSAQSTITVVSSSTVTQLTKVSGDGQSVASGHPFSAVVVQALNTAGQPVGGADIEWTAPGVTTTTKTNTNGQASISLTAGAAGTVPVTATVVANRALTVTFLLTVTP